MAASSPSAGAGQARRRLRLPLGGRISLAAITAGVAGLTAIANAVAAGTPASEQTPSRLGASIQQSVQERDEARVRQQRALDMREQAVKASQARLKADLEGRQSASPASTADPRASSSDRDPTPYDDLSRIYQTMKPARAAPIFERLDLDVQTAVARRMRERSTALIMASMTPDAAVRLSMALAGKRIEDRPVVQRAPVPGRPMAGEVAVKTPAAKGPAGSVKAPGVTKAAQQTPKPPAAVPEKG
ncbi:MAG TPA: magnesium transporter [Sphingobium sp.]|uniref:MotE family protein n=1 Tax=Sphingobium sp. TaxID=1912891 RepID=UPI002ED00D85